MDVQYAQCGCEFEMYSKRINQRRTISKKQNKKQTKNENENEKLER